MSKHRCRFESIKKKKNLCYVFPVAPFYYLFHFHLALFQLQNNKPSLHAHIVVEFGKLGAGMIPYQ